MYMYMSKMYSIRYICTCSNTYIYMYMYMYISKMCNIRYIYVHVVILNSIMYIKLCVNHLSCTCTCTYTGVIQTAYANGSSTRYLTDVLVSKGHSNFHIFTFFILLSFPFFFVYVKFQSISSLLSYSIIMY